MRIVGRDAARAVTLPHRALLAPMEGITDRTFRSLIIAHGGVGAACTEFIRISAAPVPRRIIARELGAQPADCPVGVQLMAADPEHLVATIAYAEAAGAAFIDLNFGCPAPVVFNKCAGSGLLAHPQRIAALVATAVAATGLPVTAKIRAGITDTEPLETVCAAVLDAGAAALTVHGRLRVQGYHQPPTWAWIARAVAERDRRWPGVPVIGNGSVQTPADAARLRAETGCDAVMVGRGALADPFVFRALAGGAAATPDDIAAFAQAYVAAMIADGGPGVALSRLKQFVKHVTAAQVLAGREDDRRTLLRLSNLDALLTQFGAACAAARIMPT